jgi:hypothetical protein
MKLTDQERGMGLMVVTCKCCGNEHKAHGAMNACSYSMTPNFGCDKCQGVVPKSKLIELQQQSI